MPKIAIDVMSGDFAPDEIIKGCAKASKEISSKLVLVGKEELIKQKLANYAHNADKIEILNANDVITMEDSPLKAIRSKIIICEVNKAPLNLVDYIKMWLYTKGSQTDLMVELDSFGSSVRGLTEGIFRLFTAEVEQIFGRGILANFVRTRGYHPFVLGKIDFVKTAISPPTKIFSHFFQLQFEKLTIDY